MRREAAELSKHDPMKIEDAVVCEILLKIFISIVKISVNHKKCFAEMKNLCQHNRKVSDVLCNTPSFTLSNSTV